MSESTSSLRPAIATYFTKISEAGTKGPIGELVAILSQGILDYRLFASHVSRHGASSEEWFKRQLLDLSIGFIENRLSMGTLTEGDLGDVRALNAFLRINDGDFHSYRPAEVAAILAAQLEVILDDAEISNAEELLQVELQAAFGLGYDDYLALGRAAFERTFLDLQLQTEAQGNIGQDAKRKLAALEPLYRLATARRRSSGALY